MKICEFIVWQYHMLGKLVSTNNVDSKENAFYILRIIAYMV